MIVRSLEDQSFIMLLAQTMPLLQQQETFEWGMERVSWSEVMNAFVGRIMHALIFPPPPPSRITGQSSHRIARISSTK